MRLNFSIFIILALVVFPHTKIDVAGSDNISIELISLIPFNSQEQPNITISASGHFVAVADNLSIKIFDAFSANELTSLENVGTTPFIDDEVPFIFFSPNEAYFVIYNTSNLAVYDINELSSSNEVSLSYEANNTLVAGEPKFNQQSTLFVFSVIPDNEVLTYVLDLNTLKLTQIPGSNGSIAFDAMGESIVTGTFEDKIVEWHLNTPEPQKLGVYNVGDFVNEVSYSCNGQFLIFDLTVKRAALRLSDSALYEIGELIYMNRNRQVCVDTTLAINENRRASVTSFSGDEPLQLWSVSTRFDRVFDVTSDGQLVVAIDDGKTVVYAAQMDRVESERKEAVDAMFATESDYLVLGYQDIVEVYQVTR